MQPTAVVQDIYAAFARGDVEAICNRMTRDVAWEPGMADHGVAWLMPGSGTAHVRRFFQIAAEDLDVRIFQPVALLTGDGHVARWSTSRPSCARPARSSTTATFTCGTFDDASKVTALRHFLDTHQHVAATHAGAAGAP